MRACRVLIHLPGVPDRAVNLHLRQITIPQCNLLI